MLEPSILREYARCDSGAICPKGLTGFRIVPGISMRNPTLIALALIGTIPAIILFTLSRTQGVHASPLVASFLFGLGILCSAFLLSWAAEAFEHDISHGFALALVAIITVLPEYAVDFSLVWKAGSDPVYANYAVANMTGANRLLIGMAWPLIVSIVWIKALRRVRPINEENPSDGGASVTLPVILRPLSAVFPGLRNIENGSGRIELHRNQAIELSFLGMATLYAFAIPLKGHIDLMDSVVLIVLFGAYMWLSSRAAVVEPDLVGPAAMIGGLSTGKRRATVATLFAFAATIIFLSAEPFAEGMIETGKSIGIDEFLLIQWVAPLASEAPEIIVAGIFALRGDAASALGLLISAKVNQWTLLVGSLPIVYSVSVGAPSALPLDTRQAQEVLLTAAQSGFAIVLLAPLFLAPRGALALFVLFITQLLIPVESVRFAFSFLYIFVTVGMIALSGRRRRALIALPRRAYREGYKITHHAEEESPGSPPGHAAH